MPMQSLYFEDFEPGQELETEARMISDADVRAFAEVSGDRNPLHLDEDYGRQSTFGQRVAHGALGLSVATGLLNQTRLTRGTLVALLGLSWDFVAPLFIGTTVRAGIRVRSKRRTSTGSHGLVVLDVTLMDDQGETLQRGQFKMLVKCRPEAGPIEP